MIPAIKKILFATDLSDTSRNAFNYAVSLAESYGGGIVLLYIIEDLPQKNMLANFVGAEVMETLQEKNKESAKEILIGKKTGGSFFKQALGTFTENTISDIKDANFVIDVIVKDGGHVAEGIINQSEESGCDIIVMGHHPRGALGDIVFGSCINGVLRKSKVPVLLAPLPK